MNTAQAGTRYAIALKCIGGTHHGRRVACPGRTVEFPILYPEYGTPYASFTPSDTATIKTETYERFECTIAGCHIIVLRRAGMSDGEFWRRMADIVEL